MDIFLFIIIIVAIMTFGEIATKVGVPLTKRLADFLEGRAGKAPAQAPPPELIDAIEALENRLARIEDRLDFLEELKAPQERRSLPSD